MKTTLLRYLIAALLSLSSTASQAQFGNFLKDLKNAAEAAKQVNPAAPTQPKQDNPATPTQQLPPGKPTAQTLPVAPTPQAGAKNSERDAWLKNPTASIPDAVSDEDVNVMFISAINRIFKVLNSGELSSAYSKCKSKELGRLSSTVSTLRKNAEQARKVDERDKLISQANELDKLKSKFTGGSCFLRLHRRVALDLDLPALGEQPKYGPKFPVDETLDVVTLFRVAEALEGKKFTGRFYEEFSKELDYDHDEWFQKVVVKNARAGAAELRKNLTTKKQTDEFDAGVEFLLARKLVNYNKHLLTILTGLGSGYTGLGSAQLTQ